MKILMLSGSRNREGRTAKALNAISNGVVKAGGNYESIFLPELKIERCSQCDQDGWGVCRSEQKCIINDDFSAIVAKIELADAVVFASPVYFIDLSESMRAFLERLRRITPIHGPYARGIHRQATPAIGICLAGGGGGGASNVCMIMERIMKECGFDVVDMVPIRRQNLEFKIAILELTGQWLVTKPKSAQDNPAG
jgi:multimeric flavodoxin WrbA